MTPASSGKPQNPSVRRFPDRKLLAETAGKLKYSFPPELPISSRAEEIAELWRKHQVIIVGGATGSGKTTQLPKIALMAGCGRYGRIGCTQPRRLAASAMAKRTAAELGCECGREVGFQVRFTDCTSADTVIKFMTDGILLSSGVSDRQLREYDCLIIDEAHERTLNIDFILGFLKNLLSRRSDLKIAISSATLDTEQFLNFFPGSALVNIEGRTFPVEDHYQIPFPDEELDEQIARAVDFAGELDPAGDILVFLPGEREIRSAAGMLNGRKLPCTEVLPLFARLSAAEQQKVFSPGSLRRIILATNVAETSLTIPRIRFCIDSGLARISRYSPGSGIQQLQIENISQASIRQRRGRCGRIRDGVCIHLYSEDDERRAAQFTDPEIKRSSLAGVILQMALLKLPDILHFPFIDPPPPSLVREGFRMLSDLEAIEPDGRLTRCGYELARLPIDPHLGKMLLAAVKNRVLPEMIVTAAFLSIADPRERPAEKAKAADDAQRIFFDERSDFLSILKMHSIISSSGNGGTAPSLSALRKFCRNTFLNCNRVREWRNLAEDISRALKELHYPVPAGTEISPEKVNYDLFHQSILSGIPGHAAHFEPEKAVYKGSSGRKYHIFPGSNLAKLKHPPEWLMSFAIVETSRVFARMNAAIKAVLLERAVPHLLTRSYDQAHYESRSGFVRAREKVFFRGLPLSCGRKVDYAGINPAEAREIFIREGLCAGLADCPGNPAAEFNAERERLLHLEQKMRRPDSVWDAENCCEFFLKNLGREIVSLPALKKSGTFKMPPTEVMMQSQLPDFDEADYPDELEFSGAKFKLYYCFAPGEKEDGVRLAVPQDEVNMLPPWALSCPVPGYRRDMAEHLLRSLPKDLRRQFTPLRETIDNFCAELKNGGIFKERPFAETLAEYLGINPNRFPENISLPPYLSCKLLLLDKNGRSTGELDEIPGSTDCGSQISSRNAALVSMTVKSAGAWPVASDGRTEIPEQILLPGGGGKPAYFALTDETDGVGRQLFLRREEAELRHRAGLVKLFLLENRPHMKFLRRDLKFSRNILLNCCVQDKTSRYADDFVYSCVAAAFGENAWHIRTPEQFEEASAEARVRLGEIMPEYLALLENTASAAAEIGSAVQKLKLMRSGTALDLQRQLNLLFRPGFMKDALLWSDYRRYLRAMRIRADRAAANPQRDAEKNGQLGGYLERLYTAAATVDELTLSVDLHSFHRLVQECLIALFAPEVALKIRNPLKLLPEKWESLRL